jgi:CRP/FNR family transcriptional regulator, dissimilatory nitrate respiration regulator
VINVAEVLQACNLFARVGPEILDRLVGMALVRRHAKGEVIFRQDDPTPGIFVVVSGAVRLYKVAPNGKEHVLHIAGPGDTFAEVAVIGRLPCPAHAEALEVGTCVMLPDGPFVEALHESHTMCLQMMSGMAFWVRRLVDSMEGIVLRDAAGRVARYLIDAGGNEGTTVRLPGRNRDIASHLNMTSESFSRTLRYLREAKLIKEGRGSNLTILDADGLHAVADDMAPKF